MPGQGRLSSGAFGLQNLFDCVTSRSESLTQSGRRLLKTTTEAPSKKQVAKLPPEQHEIIGQIALRKAGSRTAILEKAQRYRGSMIVCAILWVSYLWLCTWVDDVAVLLPVMGVLLYIEFHDRGINSRIDALLKLADLDRSLDESDQAEQTSEDKG